MGLSLGAWMAIGSIGSAVVGGLMAPDAPGPTPPPEVPKPIPMAKQPNQKKTEQDMALASAGQLTPSATLLSGNERRSVLGG